MQEFMKRDTELDPELLKLAESNPDVLLKKNEKSYMILYYATDPESKEEEKSWHVAIGRKETYEFIKSMIKYIDLENTKVVVEGTSFENAKNAYETMKYLAQFMNDPTFNIDEYYVKEPEEEANN